MFLNIFKNSLKLSKKELKYKYAMRKFFIYDKILKQYKFLRTNKSKISRFSYKI